MNILIAHNPHAGSFRAEKLEVLRSLLSDKGHDCRTIDSYSDKFADDAAWADHICVYGGDGTLRDVIDRLPPKLSDITMSVYPSGTINLIAREGKYPAALDRFTDRILDLGQTKKYYTVQSRQGRFLACASVGPDSYAVAGLSTTLKKKIGRFAYVAAFLKQMIRWPRHSLQITADGAEHFGEAIYILKGRFFAGPWVLDSQANLEKPEMRLLILPRAGRIDFLRLCLSAFAGEGFTSKDWQRVSCKKLSILGCSDSDGDHGAQGIPLQADGDIVGNLPMEFKVSNNSIPFV